MKKCNLPTRKECFDIIKEYHVPLHILNHSLAVAKLAGFLAERLREKAVAVDVNLVDRACLLHDTARVCDFERLDYSRFKQTVTEQDKAKWRQIRAKYKGIRHEDAAYEIFKEKYPVLALTIKRHKYTAMLNKQTRPNTWEEKIVYYSDMRVMHEAIVPLKSRLEDGHKRNAFLHCSYLQGKINTDKIDLLIYRLEEEIFAKVGLDPLKVTDEFVDSYIRAPCN